jgi:hypothetical protein
MTYKADKNFFMNYSKDDEHNYHNGLWQHGINSIYSNTFIAGGHGRGKTHMILDYIKKYAHKKKT